MILDLIKENRSYRRFDEAKPILRTQLETMIEAARISPCAANLQTLRFYISATPATNQAIYPHIKWAGYLRYWDGPVEGERPAAFILVLAPRGSSQFHHTDSGIAAQSILLTATEMNFGGCIIASLDKEAVHHNLSLPEDYSIVMAIALGVPAEKVTLDDVVDPDDIEYWRDDEDVHHVPKRALKDILIN